MPKFVRFYIKTALIFFLLSLLIGILMIARPLFDLPSYVSSSFPTYLHLFMVGWITQLIFGVSIWMFPAPDHGGRYGNENVIWAIYWTLNVGLVFRFLGEPGKLLLRASLIVNWLLVLSAVLQWTAGLLYAYHIWGRVKGK